MKNIAALVFLVLLPFIDAQASELKPYEMPRTEVVPIKDSKTGRQYELYVKLPEDYAKNTDINYPVIYTTDAKWHMDMLSGATEYLMPDVILVGISWQTDLDGEEEYFSRFRDYTTITSENSERQAKYQFGQAGYHLSFIRDEIIPYVENNYRADAGGRTYFGYSLGGAFGAYILFAQPDSFKNYIFGSPAFSERSLKDIDDLEAKLASQQKDLDAHVFVSIGELETSEMEITKGFISILERRSQSGLSLTGLEIIEDSDHGTAFPETTIRGIKWLSKLIDE